MNKLVMFLLGLIAGLSGLFLIALTPYVIATKSISTQMLDSEIDKLFFFLMSAGAGMCYCMASICLLKNWKPQEHRPVALIGMISCFAFIAGLYYHMMFNSPW